MAKKQSPTKTPVKAGSKTSVSTPSKNNTPKSAYKTAKSTPVSTKGTPSKVVKTPVAAKKTPKGKVVKAPELESLNETALAQSKKGKSKATAESSLVPSTRISKALSELQKFTEKSSESKSGKSQLFEDELINNVQIILNKKDLFTSKKNFKPTLIKIEGETNFPKRTVALFVRDDLISKELLDKIEESELKDVISEIIQASELKTTYKQYEKRRELFSKYDLFLSDDALITSLPKLLGKVFYESKKVPIPVRMTDGKFSIESIQNQIQTKVLKSIIYQTPRSNSLTINLGSLETLNDSIITQVINNFQKENLTAIFLKSNQSPALPLYEVDTVYTDADVKSEESSIEKSADDVELSTFEKGLVELADPSSKIADLLVTKKDKIAKKVAKKQNKDNKKITNAEASKVTKPVVNKKKRAFQA